MKTVLIVDDAAFMRNSLKLLLKDTAFKVVGEAENGQEAIKEYKKLSPDIVTMDITMPKMSGVDAVEEIMKIDKHANIVMISAIGQKEFILRSINLGAKNFIVKPFRKDKVLQVLKEI